MASNIDPNEPQEVSTTTADTRANFQAAKDEIEALQAKDVTQDSAISGKEPANANIQTHIGQTAGQNPHGTTKATVGLSNADNTSDLDKPISTATTNALNNKEDAFTKNTAFNKNFGGGATDVAAGNHTHTAADVGAAPDTHVGDATHLSSDERAGMTAAAPTGVDPLITQNDLNAHTANTTLHITTNQNDALDGANAPNAGNVFATIADVGSGDLTDAVFPTYAVFDEEVAGDATIDFSDGNKQTVDAATYANLTLSAPGVGNYILQIKNSGSLVGITPTPLWDSGTAPTWAGTAILALYWDGISFYGSAIVGAS